ncbi:hypothetical protein MPTK1_1g12820 [Marchantia polymorpha subsp. ruderalis]|uniref:Thylakoid membrane protein slr0575 n=2 Tax=Marchantia polymorpha TaxID=3197 RepID=A0A176VJD3_MARPO|nr:hypothetical protein AXG93_154s1510 [Marchantia polymorpha subsp. ruderalis]PTQ44616.1 hypothetical protein MARPO_0019s0052 [Marchantia polymorpha]BBM98349.1 hypothetical protein Mp_1g12820 [Marchantia polymorpha subsp. ruderalis]|eukprot:PTQ44616.1 hypothetical protein MARPO_0019s0052 [Marchantia polymorpha]
MAMAVAMGLPPIVLSSFTQSPCLERRTAGLRGVAPLRFPKLRSVQIRAATGVETSPPSNAAGASSSKEIIPDTELTITKTSFGTIGLSVGLGLLSYGFGAYFTFLPGSEWSALMLTYGFPLAIIGMALKYAELKPVPCITYADAFALRESQTTPILTQVRNDVTRFRYGDEQHLEEALKRIFRYGLGGGIQRRNAPTLTSIREEVSQDGFYTLVLVFEAKALKLPEFETRQAKFTSFFGPGVTAKISTPEPNIYEVALVADKGLQPSDATPASPSS